MKKNHLLVVLLGILSGGFLFAQEAAVPPKTDPVSPDVTLEWDKARIYNLSSGVPASVKSRVENGTTVKKGDLLITLDMSGVEDSLTDASNDTDVKMADLENVRFLLSQATAKKSRDLEVSQRKVTRLEEDMAGYVNKFLPSQMKSNDNNLAKAQFNVDYKKENLRQLEKMYSDDQITEDTEEIILTRTRNELKDAEDNLEAVKLNHEWTVKYKFPRDRQDMETAMQEAKQMHEELSKKLDIDLMVKAAAVKVAEKKYADALKKSDKLKADNALKVEAPEEGVLLWCESEKKFPVTAAFVLLSPEKTLSARRTGGVELKVGDVVKSYKINTPTSALILPNATVKSVEGDTVVFSFNS